MLAVLRVDGKLYEMELTRLLESDLIEPALARFTEKYGITFEGDAVTSGSSRLFELTPR